ncbi:MAG: hypothetical protein J2P15_10745, partial [Micromonosporaceae bacterium]|nr:hypothetical protein [Micromonosporaceae bacterium]
MNRRSLRWRRRYLAYAAALGALASFVGPVRPAIAKGATPAADAVTITVTIPRLNGNGPPGNGGPGGEGVLTMTVTDAPVELGPGTPSADGQTILFTGQLPPMTISDSRNVGRPGWTVTGQVSDFSGGGEGFSGSQLGWTPAIITQNAKRNVKV